MFGWERVAKASRKVLGDVEVYVNKRDEAKALDLIKQFNA